MHAYDCKVLLSRARQIERTAVNLIANGMLSRPIDNLFHSTLSSFSFELTTFFNVPPLRATSFHH